MKLKPLGDRLIVRAIEEEELTASGLVLPDTAKEKPQKGLVIAVGDGKFDEDGAKRIPLDVAEGDEVLDRSTAARKSRLTAKSCSRSASPTFSPRSSRNRSLHA